MNECICPPTIGAKIDDFQFEAYHAGKIVKKKMSDFHGKWLVILFYPADFTFVCPTELEDMATYYDDLTSLGADVISVSTDTVFVHKAWHDQSPTIKKITFPMVADPTAKLSRFFGVYIAEEGVALRGTFIINPKGELAAYEINNNDIGRSAAETFRKVQAAKFVSEHRGQVCPASWKPGAKTLKPGLDLVGKI